MVGKITHNVDMPAQFAIPGNTVVKKTNLENAVSGFTQKIKATEAESLLEIRYRKVSQKTFDDSILPELKKASATLSQKSGHLFDCVGCRPNPNGGMLYTLKLKNEYDLWRKGISPEEYSKRSDKEKEKQLEIFPATEVIPEYLGEFTQRDGFNSTPLVISPELKAFFKQLGCDWGRQPTDDKINNIKEGEFFLILPDKDAVEANSEKLFSKYPGIQPLRVKMAEGIADDASFIKSYVNYDLLISSDIEFWHDEGSHLFPLIRWIFATKDKESDYVDQKMLLLNFYAYMDRSVMMLEKMVDGIKTNKAAIPSKLVKIVDSLKDDLDIVKRLYGALADFQAGAPSKLFSAQAFIDILKNNPRQFLNLFPNDNLPKIWEVLLKLDKFHSYYLEKAQDALSKSPDNASLNRKVKAIQNCITKPYELIPKGGFDLNNMRHRLLNSGPLISKNPNLLIKFCDQIRKPRKEEIKNDKEVLEEIFELTSMMKASRAFLLEEKRKYSDSQTEDAKKNVVTINDQIKVFDEQIKTGEFFVTVFGKIPKLIDSGNVPFSSVSAILNKAPHILNINPSAAQFLQQASIPFTMMAGAINLIGSAVNFDAAHQTFKLRTALKKGTANWNTTQIKQIFDLKKYTPPTDDAQKQVHLDAFSKHLFSKTLKYSLEGTANLVYIAAGIVFVNASTALPLLAVGLFATSAALLIGATVLNVLSDRQLNKSLSATENAAGL